MNSDRCLPSTATAEGAGSALVDLAPSAAMGNQVRVAVVAQNCSTRMGGEAAIPYHYFRLLRGRGVDAYLVAHARNRAELESSLPDEVDRMCWVPDTVMDRLLHRIGELVTPRMSRVSIGFVARIYEQWAERGLVKRLVRERGVNVVHQPTPVSPLEPSLMFAVGAPVVIGPMNGGMDYPPGFAARAGRLEMGIVRRGRSLAKAANFLFPGKRRARLLLVANQRTRRALGRCVPGEAIELPENGVDLDLWAGSEHRSAGNGSTAGQPVRFVFMGRLVDWKGVDLLLHAWQKLQGAAREVELLVIGEGSERAALEAQADKLGISRSVQFKGWLSQRGCAAELADADVLVLPSLIECGAAVVLEAMASGLPVIATKWGGPSDYLDPSCGILLDPEGESAFIERLAEAMKTLAGSPALRQKMGKAGRQKVIQSFSWEAKVNLVLSLYRQIAAPRMLSRVAAPAGATR
jgi:glycosyltransferase involved in cell wall biosynthesis